jgi:hypothetical protein
MTDHTHLMLGPGRPEVDCDECFRMLDQYVDLEHRTGTAAAAMPTFAAHLAGCPVCHEEYESLLTFVADDAQSPSGA